MHPARLEHATNALNIQLSFQSALMRALTVAVGADNVALLDLTHYRSNRLSSYGTKLE